VSIRSIGFVPSAPLLVPEVAGGSAGDDDGLRAACLRVVGSLAAGRPAEIVAVASVVPAVEPGEWPVGASWDFTGFGVRRVPTPAGPTLPWQLGIAAWLLDQAGWAGGRRYLAAAGDQPLDRDGDVAVLVVGDGSACRTERSPAYFDPRAEALDNQVADLLARGDAAGLAGLDPVLAGELVCAGAPVWRRVAASVGATAVTEAELLAHVAPYGVGYFVARWVLG
jgi:hypothetical protein